MGYRTFLVLICVSAAIGRTTKPGQCPVGTLEQPCQVGVTGCQSDGECVGDLKCCPNAECGYNECKDPAGAIACPRSISAKGPRTRSEPTCQSVSTCASGELCCEWFGTKYCLEGISTAPKPGNCPAQPADQFCLADLRSCRFDFPCSGDKKCCRNANCGYNICMDPVTPICIEIGCQDTAGPNCKNVEVIQPNGPGCPPTCKICNDPVEPVCSFKLNCGSGVGSYKYYGKRCRFTYSCD